MNGYRKNLQQIGFSMMIKHAIIGAAVLALTALSGPALASGNAYTVAVGHSTANTSYALSAQSAGPIQWSFQRTAPFSTNVNLNCTSGNLSATGSTVNGGTSGGGAPTAIANMPGLNIGGCTGPGGGLTVTTSTPMVIQGTSSATTSATDVVQVRLQNVNIDWRNAVCHLRIAGSVSGSFNEATQQLTFSETGFSGNLKYTLVAGCLGLYQGAGNVNFQGTFNVTTAGGAINLR